MLGGGGGYLATTIAMSTLLIFLGYIEVEKFMAAIFKSFTKLCLLRGVFTVEPKTLAKV